VQKPYSGRTGIETYFSRRRNLTTAKKKEKTYKNVLTGT